MIKNSEIEKYKSLFSKNSYEKLDTWMEAIEKKQITTISSDTATELLVKFLKGVNEYDSTQFQVGIGTEINHRISFHIGKQKGGGIESEPRRISIYFKGDKVLFGFRVKELEVDLFKRTMMPYEFSKRGRSKGNGINLTTPVLDDGNLINNLHSILEKITPKFHSEFTSSLFKGFDISENKAKYKRLEKDKDLNNKLVSTLKNIKEYPRDKVLINKAKKSAKYKCELNPDHKTFKSKDGKPYLEVHHFIPMSFQDEYIWNNQPLDIIENLMCLCPNCHAKFHHLENEELKELLEEHYFSRYEKMANAGLKITFQMLLTAYGLSDPKYLWPAQCELKAYDTDVQEDIERIEPIRERLFDLFDYVHGKLFEECFFVSLSTTSDKWECWDEDRVSQIESLLEYDMTADGGKLSIMRISSAGELNCTKKFIWQLSFTDE